MALADFLRKYTPFEVFSEDDLLALAGSGRVLIFTIGRSTFSAKATPKGRFLWMIQQGKVELLDDAAAGRPVRDMLGEGDLLGIERFAGDGSFLLSARTATDVILHAVSAELVEDVDGKISVGEALHLCARFRVRDSWIQQNVVARSQAAGCGIFAGTAVAAARKRFA